MELPDFNKIFENYQQEILKDITVDELNLRDRAMSIPVIKHKWVGRQMIHKDQHRKLTELRKKIVKGIVKSSPVTMSKAMIDGAVSGNADISKIDESISELEVIIEYLEKIEKITSSLTFDCKNVIDIQKLETT